MTQPQTSNLPLSPLSTEDERFLERVYSYLPLALHDEFRVFVDGLLERLQRAERERDGFKQEAGWRARRCTELEQARAAAVRETVEACARIVEEQSGWEWHVTGRTLNWNIYGELETQQAIATAIRQAFPAPGAARAGEGEAEPPICADCTTGPFWTSTYERPVLPCERCGKPTTGRQRSVPVSTGESVAICSQCFLPGDRLRGCNAAANGEPPKPCIRCGKPTVGRLTPKTDPTPTPPRGLAERLSKLTFDTFNAALERAGLGLSPPWEEQEEDQRETCRAVVRGLLPEFVKEAARALDGEMERERDKARRHVLAQSHGSTEWGIRAAAFDEARKLIPSVLSRLLGASVQTEGER